MIAYVLIPLLPFAAFLAIGPFGRWWRGRSHYIALPAVLLSLLLFGGDTLKDFAFAMLVGVISGAYSSIFVAAPILAVVKEREPKFAQLRTRADARAAAGRPLRAVPAGAAVERETGSDGGEAVPSGVGAAAAGRPTTRSRPGPQRPRPRPKKKRKRR